jgi:predicted enzyme related to lactoylglutathione lyase
VAETVARDLWPPAVDVPGLELHAADPTATSTFVSAVFGGTVQAGRWVRDGQLVATVVTTDDATPQWVPVLRTPTPAQVIDDLRAAGGLHDGTRCAHPLLGRFVVAAPEGQVGWPAPTGHLSWVQLNSADPAGSAALLDGLLGWRRSNAGNPRYTYWLLEDARDAQRGGIMAIDARSGEVEPGWQIYLAADGPDDVDRRTEMAVEAGATVLVPPTDLRIRRFAVVQDPAGAVLGIDASLPDAPTPEVLT